MKTILGVYVVVSLFLLSVLGLSPNAFGSSPCEITIYPSSKIDDMKNLNVAGVELAEYGYVMVYQYVLVNAETLCVLGRTTSDEILLSVITRNNPSETMMKKYSTTIAWFSTGITLKVLYLNTLQPSIPFVLLEYVDGNISRESEETATHLEIFRVDADQATLLHEETIAETNVIFTANSDPAYKYRYIYSAGEDPSQGYEPLVPANVDIAKIFFTDANDDGYGDILVWKQRYRSRLIEEPGEEDFVLEKEELQAMYFEENGLTIFRTNSP